MILRPSFWKNNLFFYLFRQKISLKNIEFRGVLQILHQGGGGTEVHVRELCQLHYPQSDFTVLKAKWRLTPVTIDIHFNDGTVSYLRLSWFTTSRQLFKKIRNSSLQGIHLHHHHMQTNLVFKIAKFLPNQYALTLHDFSWVHHSPQLLNNSSLKSVLRFKMMKKRLKFILNNAGKIISPSKSTQAIYSRLGIKSEQIYHFESPRPELDHIHLTNENFQLSLDILVLGNILAFKGANRIIRIAKKLDKYGFRIHSYGGLEHKRALPNNIVMYGQYKREDILTMAREKRFRVVLHPIEWDETYSYVYSEILSLGIPSIATALGAIPERTINSQFNLLLPQGASDEIWCNSILDMSWLCLEKTPVKSIKSDSFKNSNNFYQKHYVKMLKNLYREF